MTRLIAIDFDGVIHSYLSPWVSEGVIPDPPVKGAIDFIRELFANNLRVCIFSTRNTKPEGINAMKLWLAVHGLTQEEILRIAFPTEKPNQANLFIDDRGYHFNGVFPTAHFCSTFRPWNRH